MTGRPPDDAQAGVRALRRAGRALLALPRPLAWIPPLAWAAGIFALSSLGPGGGPPRWWELGGFTANFAHPVIFGILAMLLVPVLGRAPGPDGRRWTGLSPIGALWTFVAVTLYGFTDELHQSTVEGRDASLYDLASDAVGAASVLVVIAYLGREDADGRGLTLRLAIGTAACAAAAGLATLSGDGPWPF